MRRKNMKKLLVILAAVVLFIPALSFAEGERVEEERAIDEGNELVMYTSLETDETEELDKIFNRCSWSKTPC
jgi:hypothetical protein